MEYDKLLKKYNEAIAYIKNLEEENKKLKSQISEVGIIQCNDIIVEQKTNNGLDLIREEVPQCSVIDDKSSNKEKIELYLSLFRGRDNVCAKRWVSCNTGNTGYAPYCYNDWVEGVCGKKKNIKCSKCENQKFIPLDEPSLRKHLKGEEILGLYPINQDDMCYLIVMDFDKDNWKEEISIVNSLCNELNIPAYMERSRSGNGGHLWFFFEDKLKASKARKFANLILDKAMQKNSLLSFEAYDRLIPSQDFLQKDGFGNLISLPLQKKS